MKFNPIRTFFPKYYVRRGLERCHRNFAANHRKMQNSPVEERNKLVRDYHDERREWEEWLTSIEDIELIKNAKQVGAYLDEIPLPKNDEDDLYRIKNSHFYSGSFGNALLDPDTRRTLLSNYRSKLPEYKKERREIVGLWLKGGGVLIGIIGALTGLVAVYNKCGLSNSYSPL